MNIKTLEIIEEAEKASQPIFKQIEQNAYINQQKVLDAFRKLQISPRHFNPSTGYGYDDVSRDTLAKLFAEVFEAEAAIVSPNIANGTHALTIALFGMLKTADTILFATGAPYDTLQTVLSGKNIGSLADFGIKHDIIELKNDRIDYEALGEYLSKTAPKVVFLTRSKGYAWRNALSISDIAEAVSFIKGKNKDIIVAVDNCYGEFVDIHEPTAVGADVIIGSLIKNPGGGLAPTGGYIAGKSDVVEQISYRLTSPSIGTEVGSYFAPYLPFYQGFFMAPTVVASALKGCVLAGYAFSALGYDVNPSPDVFPTDIIRSIKFDTEEELVGFCQSIQYASPVDSHVTPYPWDMPGYDHQVIMAAGSFIQGASIELSADSPIKAPYIAYMQGGLTYEHCKIAISEAVDRILQHK